MADGEREGSDVVKTIGQLLALAAGFLGLVYAAGGGVLALRLFLADLPSRTIVSQLPRDVLISIGLAQIVLPVLGVAAVYLIYRLARDPTPPPRRFVHEWTATVGARLGHAGRRERDSGARLRGLIALGSDTVREESNALLWLVPLAFLVTMLVVLVALSLRAKLVNRYGYPERLWGTRRPIVLMTLVVALAAVPICVLFAGAFFALLDAKVCTSQSEVTGVLIGETSDRTYIGQTDRPRGPLLVFSIPTSEIKETFIGGDADRRPCSAPATSG